MVVRLRRYTLVIVLGLDLEILAYRELLFFGVRIRRYIFVINLGLDLEILWHKPAHRYVLKFS